MIRPYYELRLYQMQPTRMPRFHELMRDHVPALFAKNGVSKPLGGWESHAGPFAPLYGYLLPWESIDARMSAWARFYADPVWQEKLAENYAGAQRVERANVHILRPSAVWERYREAGPPRSVGGVHEMWLHARTGPVGRSEAGGAAARLDAARAHGAEVLGVFDAWIGLPTDRQIAFLAWKDEDHRRSFIECESPDTSGSAVQTQVLLPLPYATPLSGFA